MDSPGPHKFSFTPAISLVVEFDGEEGQPPPDVASGLPRARLHLPLPTARLETAVAGARGRPPNRDQARRTIVVPSTPSAAELRPRSTIAFVTTPPADSAIGLATIR